MKNHRIREYIIAALPYAIYLVVTLILFALSPYTLHSDGISVMDTARQWHQGHFLYAVNSLWPPLLSIIIAIFTFLPVHELIAFKIVQMLLGLGTLIFSDLIIRKLVQNRWVRFSVQAAAALCLGNWVLLNATADIIALTAAAFYLWLVMREKFMSGKWDGVWLGAAWCIGYYSRAYLLWFIAAHIVFMFFYKRWLIKEPAGRKILWRNLFVAVGVFIVLSSPWLIGLHAKYHQWTTGISGTLNYYKYGPEAVGAPLSPMFADDHLIPPPAGGQSILTDPFTIMPPKWSPFQSKQAFEYQVLAIWKNLKIMFAGIPSIAPGGLLPTFSPLIAGTLFAFFVLLCMKRELLRNSKLMMLLSVMVIYPLGYMIIEVDDRYFYIMVLIGLYMGAYILEYVLAPEHKKTLIAAAMIMALTYIPFTPDKDLIAGYSFYSRRRLDGLNIAANLPSVDKRAADLGDTEDVSFRALYFAGIPFYWYLNPTVPLNSVISELCKNKIDYAFIENDSSNPQIAARYEALKNYFSGEYRLQYFPDSVLYDPHLPCATAAAAVAGATTAATASAGN